MSALLSLVPVLDGDDGDDDVVEAEAKAKSRPDERGSSSLSVGVAAVVCESSERLARVARSHISTSSRRSFTLRLGSA